MSCVKYDDSSNDSDDLANQNITRVMHARNTRDIPTPTASATSGNASDGNALA